MPSIACYTLGCKVNQYDTQAMLESFINAGYTPVSFKKKADVYLINTCTVTGTSDKKSFQIIRRMKREHPTCELIIAGCLAQRNRDGFKDNGARLIIGTQNRSRIVELFHEALKSDVTINDVRPIGNAVYEPLHACSCEGKTRATLKIQEGCGNRCAYCVVPITRGHARSRRFPDIISEAEALIKAGYKELVLTGIHLSSYGPDLEEGHCLADVVTAVNALPGIERIRLGSLEPGLITPDFTKKLASAEKLCPHFHPVLQSGSDTILRSMGRKYDIATFLRSVSLLRSYFPGASITTDVIAGFPGETEANHRETLSVLESVGFAKLHVFPYSVREGTRAASLPDQLTEAVKEDRAREITRLGRKTAARYREEFIGTVKHVLFESFNNGYYEGYTGEYVKVLARNAVPGQVLSVSIKSLLRDGERMLGDIIPDEPDG